MTTKRVLVGTPTKSGYPTYQMRAIASVIENPIEGFDIDFVPEDTHQAINLARNCIAHAAVEQNYDINVQIDSDHPWNRDHLARILSHSQPIVSGLYCKKAGGNPQWVGLRNKEHLNVRDDGLVRADYVPTGFLRVDVSVYRAMRAKMPERRFASTHDDGSAFEAWELFPIGLVGPNTPESKLARIRKVLDEGTADRPAFDRIASIMEELRPEPARLLGEDYFFSHLATKCGFELYIDVKCGVSHMGQAPYPIPKDYVPTEASDIKFPREDLRAW